MGEREGREDQEIDLTEGVGENSSPPRSYGGAAAGVGGSYDLRDEVFNKLLEIGCVDAVSDPDAFHGRLDAHFSRMPPSYVLDVTVDKAEDVVLHQRLLAQATKQLVYEIRCAESLGTGSENEDEPVNSASTARFALDTNDGAMPLHKRTSDSAIDFEPCSKFKDLNLDVRRATKGIWQQHHTDNICRSQEKKQVPVHEVIFSSVDKPKLLSQLSALLSDIGLNIREAHVFSTTDGLSLDVFVVDGWHTEDTDGLYEAIEKAIASSEGTCSGSSYSHSAENVEDWEIDRSMLKIGDKFASGSCSDLHRGDYLGRDVAVKILRSEELTDTRKDEFAQEVFILREVEHRNVVQFFGACTKSPFLCIVNEYMPGGSLFDYLHDKNKIITVPQLLEFAIDVSKGMEYLHQKNIIHRDLKTANLLMDANNVVKVADFGIARFLDRGGHMTAETGTYRWMAPEIMTHEPYDEKADVYSFAIVLWELMTRKLPYSDQSPLQAALGVKKGNRPEIPENAHPDLLELMQRCWDAEPTSRPSFSEIRVELETILQNFQENPQPDTSS